MILRRSINRECGGSGKHNKNDKTQHVWRDSIRRLKTNTKGEVEVNYESERRKMRKKRDSKLISKCSKSR